MKKRILSAALAVLSVLTMGVTSFAAEMPDEYVPEEQAGIVEIMDDAGEIDAHGIGLRATHTWEPWVDMQIRGEVCQGTFVPFTHGVTEAHSSCDHFLCFAYRVRLTYDCTYHKTSIVTHD